MGSIAGRKGSFLLQDAGTLEGNTVSGQWFVIPGSGTGELGGLRGEGSFTAALGEGADLTLDYWFGPNRPSGPPEGSELHRPLRCRR